MCLQVHSPLSVLSLSIHVLRVQTAVRNQLNPIKETILVDGLQCPTPSSLRDQISGSHTQTHNLWHLLDCQGFNFLWACCPRNLSIAFCYLVALKPPMPLTKCPCTTGSCRLAGESSSVSFAWTLQSLLGFHSPRPEVPLLALPPPIQTEQWLCKYGMVVQSPAAFPNPPEASGRGGSPSGFPLFPGLSFHSHQITCHEPGFFQYF